MSLEIERNAENLALCGRLDTATAPMFEQALDGVIARGEAVTLDMSRLEYVSSAGLRVLLKAYKALGEGLRLVNVGESVMEVLEITGFTEFLAIDE